MKRFMLYKHIIALKPVMLYIVILKLRAPYYNWLIGLGV